MIENKTQPGVWFYSYREKPLLLHLFCVALQILWDLAIVRQDRSIYQIVHLLIFIHYLYGPNR